MKKELNEKKSYESPKIQVITIDSLDIIAQSPSYPPEDDEEPYTDRLN